jgi:riboflavin biosynthesis pyrimidine reductase
VTRPPVLDPVELIDRYPRNDRPTLRVNFIESVDGAATVGGLSGGLSGPGDKQVFDTLRMVCDALIVGAGTIRAENYDALRLDERSRAWRRDHGLPEFPLMVIVSGSLDLDPAQLIFSDAPIPPIAVTHAAAPADRRTTIAPVAEIVTVGDDSVDLAAAIADLHARGATQLLCEGGPHLFGALIAADLVDEVCLTVSPLLAGGSTGRISAGPPGPSRSMSLRHALIKDDMLFLRYAREHRSQGASQPSGARPSSTVLVDKPVDYP